MQSFTLIHFGFIAWAAVWTLSLSAIAFVGGGLLGFAVALARISSLPAVRAAALAYIQIVQGTPLLILLFVFYFGIAIVGFNQVPAIVSAGVGLTIYSSGF